MGQNEPTVETRRFGQYLRTIREQRRLSLDAVEEMSLGFPERVTKSHLSRIENGQAVPTFPRLFVLSQIYGIPVSFLAERFEIDLLRDMVPGDQLDRSDEDLLGEARRLRLSGRFADALVLYETLLDRHDSAAETSPAAGSVRVELRLNRINCLVHLARYASAKDESEDLLSLASLTAEERIKTMHYFVMCCYHLGKLTIALMALEQVQSETGSLAEADPLHAHLAALAGSVKMVTGRHREAADAYRRAVERFGQLGVTFEVCRVRLNLASALIECGETETGVSELRETLALAREKGYDRQVALAQSTLAVVAFREGDLDAAESLCLQSNTLARPREFIAVVFRNCYYLWKIAQHRGDRASVRANERALRAYLSRVDEHVPEAEDYRRHLTGGGK